MNKVILCPFPSIWIDDTHRFLCFNCSSVLRYLSIRVSGCVFDAADRWNMRFSLILWFFCSFLFILALQEVNKQPQQSTKRFWKPRSFNNRWKRCLKTPRVSCILVRIMQMRMSFWAPWGSDPFNLYFRFIV